MCTDGHISSESSTHAANNVNQAIAQAGSEATEQGYEELFPIHTCMILNIGWLDSGQEFEK